MKTCTHRYLGDGLQCIKPTGHPFGHVYHSSAGGHVDDHDHEAGEG